MASSSPAKKQAAAPIAMPYQMMLSGAAASWGEFCTIPFDTAKVRLQIQNSAAAAPVTPATATATATGEAIAAAAAAPAPPQRYKGLVDCLTRIVREEGFTAPWKGVSAGIQRQCAFAPIRIGLYEPVRALYMGKDFQGQPTIGQKIAAGLTTSAIGITVASPTDVVKVRLQAEGRLPPGVPRRYTGAIDAYQKIVKQEGVLGLWTGYAPNLARNCVVNATELVAYDQTKTMLLRTSYFKDDMKTHIVSGLSAGLAATLLGSPVDVVKTRVMSQKTAPGAAPEFKGPLDCAVKLFRSQGPLAFYKGFIPNFTRIGSWNIVTWVTLEQLKAAYISYRVGGK